jgi:hypothetical protein
MTEVYNNKLEIKSTNSCLEHIQPIFLVYKNLQDVRNFKVSRVLIINYKN